MEKDKKEISTEMEIPLEELESIELNASPLSEVPAEQIKKALNLLKQYTNTNF